MHPADHEPQALQGPASSAPQALQGPTHGEAAARRKGRRVVMTTYYVVVVLFIALAGGNVIWQVWAPRLRHYPPEDCRAGLRGLAQAAFRAELAAAELPEASEDEALAAFRRALLPEWDHYDAVEASCRTQGELRSALDAIYRLRYAEERAVRRETTELIPLRSKVEHLLQAELRP
jgi:hypothetical protein